MWTWMDVDLISCLCAEVEDVASSRSYADGGAYLTLPMFYLEGMDEDELRAIAWISIRWNTSTFWRTLY